MEMENLPSEISTNIFSRLPFDLVLQCKCVSKSWCNLLKLFLHSSDVYFAKLHRCRLVKNHPLKSSSSPDSVLLLLDQSVDTDQQLHYAEYNEDQNGFNCKVMKKFNCPFDMKNSKFWTMASSSNGLICSAHQTDNNDDDDSYLLCIYNPFLGEYVTLPKFKYSAKSSMAFGFGHVPSIDEYKVVRIIYPLGGGDVGNVDVYTLGGEKSSNCKWRSKGNIKCRLQGDSPGVLVNGSLHWLTEKDEKNKKQNIVAFDLLEEEFREIPLPRGLHTDNNFKIKELEGCLCGIDYRDETRMQNMWKMEDYYMKSNEEEYWKNIFSIEWTGPQGHEHWFFWKKVDQALLWSNSSVVCAEVDDSVGPKVNAEDLNGAGLFHGILHIKSLVSLTALGEYNTKTIKDDRKRKRQYSDKEEMNTKRKTKKLKKILFGRKPKKSKRGRIVV